MCHCMYLRKPARLVEHDFTYAAELKMLPAVTARFYIGLKKAILVKDIAAGEATALGTQTIHSTGRSRGSRPPGQSRTSYIRNLYCRVQWVSSRLMLGY